MTSSQRKRRSSLNRRTGAMLKRQELVELKAPAADQMPAVGREFSSPDFDRLMEEDFQRHRGVFDPALAMLGAVPSSGILEANLPVIEARMRSRAAELVMGGTTWLTAAGLPGHAMPLLAEWLEQRRIFALEQDGVQVFPRYAFDSMGEPLPMLQKVLEVLADRSPFQIASWFESPSTYLDARRPREVLELDGPAVVLAALRTVEGPVHG